MLIAVPNAHPIHVKKHRPSLLGMAVALPLLNILLSQPVQAEVNTSTSSQSESKQNQYNIAPGPMATTLKAFASAAGITLSFDPSKIESLNSNGIQGNYSIDEALQIILEGTNLQVSRTPSGGYLVSMTDEMKTLPAVNVTSNQLGTITEGSGLYTPGTVATATRLVMKPRETPQSIEVITRQHIDDFALNSIDDVMKHTPGVSIVTYDSERTEYYARGFAINEFQYDGIPMRRDSAYSAGNTLSDMAIYDRVEVLKGATGLLTGTGNPGASINLIRKKPTTEFQGEVQLEAGSWNTYRGQLDLSNALTSNGNVRGRVVTAYENKESELDRYERETLVFYGIVEVDLGENTLLTVGGDYQDNRPEASTWGGNPIFDSNGDFNKVPKSFNAGANWSSWEQYTRTMFTTLEHFFDNDWVTKLQLNHQINGYDAQLGAAAGGNPNPIDGSGARMWTGKYVGETKSNAIDFYASGPFQLLGRQHELVIGGSFSERDWSNTGYGDENYDPTVSDYYNWDGNVPIPNFSKQNISYEDDETTREKGIYTTGRFSITSDLKLLLGGRVSDYKDEYNEENGVFVPYVGAVYDLTQNVSVYASYTSIFKPQYLEDADGHKLAPVEGNSYETGLKGEFFDGRLNASAAYYVIEQDNYPEEVPNPDSSLEPWYRAAQGVKTKGYELALSGELLPNWQLHTGFTHNESKLNGEEFQTINPENQFTFYNSYQFTGKLEKLTVGGGARWQDKTWEDVYDQNYNAITHTIDDFWLVDLMAKYQFNKDLSATLNVNNILDEDYYTMMHFYSSYSWGESRSVNLRLDYAF